MKFKIELTPDDVRLACARFVEEKTKLHVPRVNAEAIRFQIDAPHPDEFGGPTGATYRLACVTVEATDADS